MPVKQHAIHIPRPEPKVPDSDKRTHYKIGLALILLGILFIFKKLDLITVTWPLLLMGLGVINLAKAWLSRRSDGVFPGIFLLLLGLIFLADSKNWIHGGVSQNWPLVILALSFSFIGSTITISDRRKNWSQGLILLVSGTFLLVVEYGWIKWGVLNEGLTWWPILLILTGIRFIFLKQIHLHSRQKNVDS